MRLTINPIAGLPGLPETSARVDGDVLTVDGIPYDLSAVPEGGSATPQGQHPFTGPITRTGGVICAMLNWHYDTSTAAEDQATEYPVRDVTAGPVPDPVIRRETSA